ncbi:MAG: hypothetical protein WBA74_20495, partial [Cyclobacteriaceae bacterium]
KESNLSSEFLSSSGLDKYIRTIYNRDISIHTQALFSFLVNQRAKQLFESAVISGSTLQTTISRSTGDTVDVTLPDGQVINLNANKNSPIFLLNFIDEDNNDMYSSNFNPFLLKNDGSFDSAQNVIIEYFDRIRTENLLGPQLLLKTEINPNDIRSIYGVAFISVILSMLGKGIIDNDITPDSNNKITIPNSEIFDISLHKFLHSLELTEPLNNSNNLLLPDVSSLDSDSIERYVYRNKNNNMIIDTTLPTLELPVRELNNLLTVERVYSGLNGYFIDINNFYLSNNTDLKTYDIRIFPNVFQATNDVLVQKAMNYSQNAIILPLKRNLKLGSFDYIPFDPIDLENNSEIFPRANIGATQVLLLSILDKVFLEYSDEILFSPFTVLKCNVSNNKNLKNLAQIEMFSRFLPNSITPTIPLRFATQISNNIIGKTWIQGLTASRFINEKTTTETLKQIKSNNLENINLIVNNGKSYEILLDEAEIQIEIRASYDFYKQKIESGCLDNETLPKINIEYIYCEKKC